MILKCLLYKVRKFDRMHLLLSFVFWLDYICLKFRQVKRDCEFLESEGIMDYSLLLGLHFADDVSESWVGLSPFYASSKSIYLFDVHI